MLARQPQPLNAIAVVGMAGKFPGAKNIREFWNNIVEGIESIDRFSEAELQDAFPDDVRQSPDFVRARSILPDVDQFDASFFGFHPREAALMDPQFRVLLECAWAALEDGGYDPARYTGSVGVFAGCSMSTYFLHHVCSDRRAIEEFTSDYQLGSYTTLMGSLTDTLATRIAYKLGLRGPAITVQSACSTSLLAIAQACQSLLLYQSDMALAGGVSITFPQKRGYLHQQGGMGSSDGHCRPFDANASGTVFGSGAGLVLLKRLEDAISDGDQIYAVVRGSAVNNDGADKVGFTAPSIDGQASVIAMAHASADVDPATIGYVECHGTATPLGDPIEFAGLAKAFSSVGERDLVALGSVKANIGHLDAAAGVAAFIKTSLALRNRVRPGLLNYKTPNSGIALDGSPFFFSESQSDWPEMAHPRRAGVSSFGVGGTNVHVILEEALTDSVRAPVAEEPLRDGHILPISARTPQSLKLMCAAIADTLAANSEPALDDVAFTLQSNRRAFPVRTAVVCRDRADAIQLLRSVTSVSEARDQPAIAFMFPGQGAQYPGMGSTLYESEPLFREWIDRGAEILNPLIEHDIRKLMFEQADHGPDGENAVRATSIAQPALFLIEFALAQLWMSRGIVPKFLAGHSVGEITAAAIAGVFSFEDGLRFIAERGRLMQTQPGGAMLAVRMSETELALLTGEEISIAAINGPALCVAAGSFEEIARLEALLQAKNIGTQRLHTSHAFHSKMMDCIIEPLRAFASELQFRAPRIPFVSGVTGNWIKDEEATSPDYWARHCREPVHFLQTIRTLSEANSPFLLEVGPGHTLTTLAAQIVPKGLLGGSSSSLPADRVARDEQLALNQAVAKLWRAGVACDWSRWRTRTGRTTSLPTYFFERQRHWIDAPPPLRNTTSTALRVSARDNELPTSSTTLSEANAPMTNPTAVIATDSRLPALKSRVLELFEAVAGVRLGDADAGTPFLELGFDSLILGQVAQQIQRRFGIKISFRQLLGELPNVDALVSHLDAKMPADAPAAVAHPPAAIAAVPEPQSPQIVSVPVVATQPVAGEMAKVFQMQLTAMQGIIDQQIRALQSNASLSSAPAATAVSVAPRERNEVASIPSSTTTPDTVQPIDDEKNARIRLYKPSAASVGDGITLNQLQLIESLVTDYNARTPGSKRYTESHRSHLADPRTVAGFRSEWKEMIYPIVCERSKGAKLWDVDGNEYVDLVNGYGQTFFGHSPDFVDAAVTAQMKQGFAIGPQSLLAGEVAQLISDVTGMERVTFCNTGSEAVMAAMRLARAVTGRMKVVTFSNDYHGQFDEVLVKPGRGGIGASALPVASGIPAESVSNIVVLQYGTAQSLEWLRANVADCAAVLVEAVQSRHPDLRPIEFLQELRKITADNDAALIFDEVVTGFRVAPGGIQSVFGIRADLATYGKVLGGGMPIGVLAGSAQYMDALDGGRWSYGDASAPEVAPTFFAGTFVRHPLVLAAARAVLLEIRKHGPALQKSLADRTAALVDRINGDLAARGLATRAETFSSWFYINFANEDRLSSLFYALMRLRGVHIYEGFPCFLTTAHTDADIDFIATSFAEALDRLRDGGVLAGSSTAGVSPERLAPAANTALPLTEPQKEVWLAAQMGDAASCVFNESLTLRFNGHLDVAALGAAINDVIARHDSLRLRFARDGESMRVDAKPQIDLAVVAISGGDEQLANAVAEDAKTPFDLGDGPLVRAKLFAIDRNHHALIFTVHHIVCDGWSINILLNEIADAYTSRTQGHVTALPEAYSFARYAQEQASPARSVDDAIETFWMSQFQKGLELPELPLDRPRPALRTFAGGTQTAFIDAALYGDIKKMAAKHGCTLFSTLFAALSVVIGRLSGHRDVVIAIPSAGQSLLPDETLVGHCVNLLPIRTQFENSTTFSCYLKDAQESVMNAFEHQEYTFGTLVRKLGLVRHANRLPLTEVQFNLERVGAKLKFGDIIAEFAPNPKSYSNFDLFMNCIESDEGLRIDCDYNADVLDAKTVLRWIGHLQVLLQSVAAQPDTIIAQLPLNTAEDTKWLRDDLNRTAHDYSGRLSMPELFAAQALAAPRAIAVQDEASELSYGELDRFTNQVARRIRQLVKSEGGRIAVAVDRSAKLPAWLLAVHRAGHAYVPIDTAHPQARIRRTLATANISALICDSAEIASFAPADTPIIRTDVEAAAIAELDGSPIGRQIDLAAPAYIIFTSGSTGVPKGVEVSHRALKNFVLSMIERPGFTAKDVLVAVTTISFDIAALELFVPLVAGGRVFVASRQEITGVFGLRDRISSSSATVAQATPSLWRMLLESGLSPGPSLKILVGGEPLPRDLANSLTQNGAEVWNMYGPTETTIWSSASRVRDDLITIGDPIANTQLHVLDITGQLSPIGVTGELFIGGDGLANGYLDRPDLTAQAFRTISLDGAAAQRLYATGDLARRRHDGSLQLLGRRDTQVKLRGFRIELEEIEIILREDPSVARCAVAVHDDEARLVAYVVTADAHDFSPDALATHLRARLPDYMIPAVWVRLAALPMTANGKLDRAALRTTQSVKSDTVRSVAQPRTPLEEKLVRTWKSVLRIESVGVTDSLFTLGADSLHIFRIAAQLIADGLPVQARDLIVMPTIAELAAELARRPSEKPASAPNIPSLKDFKGGARRPRAVS